MTIIVSQLLLFIMKVKCHFGNVVVKSPTITFDDTSELRRNMLGLSPVQNSVAPLYKDLSSQLFKTHTKQNRNVTHNRIQIRAWPN